MSPSMRSFTLVTVLLATSTGCSLRAKRPVTSKADAAASEAFAVHRPSVALERHRESTVPIAPRTRPEGDCIEGDVAVLLENGDDRCVHACTRALDCGSTATCSGQGFVSNQGTVSGVTQFCIQRGPKVIDARGGASIDPAVVSPSRSSGATAGPIGVQGG